LKGHILLVLGLESSCDETAAAIIDGRRVIAESVRSQIDLHQKYGGVVPEIASRAHLEAVEDLTAEVLRQGNLTLNKLDGLAVTQGPGLVGALLVAVSFAKGLFMATGLPITGVNHVQAHALAPFLYTEPDPPPSPEFPLVALVASGGHTALFLAEDFQKFKLLGQTLDDAAGEALDKFAKLLGLGYPGGAIVESLAQDGQPDAYPLTRPMLKNGLNFSFSGLKTQVINLYKELNLESASAKDPALKNLAASFQAAVVEVLVHKLTAAVKLTKAKGAVLAGGVACNGPLRALAKESLTKIDCRFWVPRRSWCADNGAMIAFLGSQQLKTGHNLLAPQAEAYPRWPVENALP
jgi:N6-L-threonylcarbamoyladenine synthase